MINIKNLLIVISISFIFSQSESIISYEMKMANGKGLSKNFFENLIDINTFFDNGLYVYTQLEYSVPPLLGSKSNGIEDIFSVFYAQYSNDKYDLTVGNLYLLQGMGLSLHTFQNQDIDYDNSLHGIDMSYHFNDRLDIFSTIGYANVKSRSNPADIEPSVSIKNNIGVIGTRFFHNSFELHYLTMIYNQLYDSNDLENIDGLDNELGNYLDEFTNLIVNQSPGFEMNNFEHNLGLSFMIGSVDFYLEKSLVYYNKFPGERTDGYKDYMSIYANVLGSDILYEYKDYSTTLLYNAFSNPPVVFKEPSSSLIGRNLHTVDFSNEYGHQIDINRIFDNDLNLLISYAFALHYRDGGKCVVDNIPDSEIAEDDCSLVDGGIWKPFQDVNIFDFNIYDDVSLLNDLFPYEQYSIELNNWSKNGKIYYRVGYDYYYEVKSQKETIEANSLPMQYAYKFKQGNSLTLYAELQEKKIYEMDVIDYTINEYNYDFIYFSPSYNHFGKWSLTFFSDIDLRYNDPDYIDNDSFAMDYTVNLDNAQLSLFFGSQKGGVVCANGSCVQQPDFEDGMKLTFRTSF